MADTSVEFESLLSFLKEERGFDFTGYKRASLVRRVQHRMDEIQVPDFEAYQDYLVLHPEEFTGLFNTILINVTGFFRDAEAWSYLQDTLLPDMLSRRDGQPVRAWSAGCATGEEAYTLAMVLAEALGLDAFKERVKIYATDVDDEALNIARQAVYTERDVQAVPDDLREKYFERQGQRFVFRKELRRSVIFGRNDLVQDAPISHVDILTCRNTLMYFNAQTQTQVLNRLHFGLRADGVLFLGRAEMLLSHSQLFRPLELKRRYFRKVPAPGRGQILPTRQGVADAAVTDVQAEADQVTRLARAALMAASSPQLVIDVAGRLVLVSSRARFLFGLSERDVGQRIQDLEVSYRPIELRAPIEQAVNERSEVWVRNVTWSRGADDALTFDIQVSLLNDENGSLLGTSVLFHDVTRYRTLQQELEFANRQLETAYEELQSTNEELETTNEELQSTVEELETTNEELQSTNEELETMNEELQSMNDELQLGSETQREQQEHFYRLNQFMLSVFGSMNCGVMVVDSELQVMSWNARAEDLWGIRSDEAEGESLDQLDIGLPLESLQAALKTQFNEQDSAPEVIRLDAVNRRGHPIALQVTVSHLVQDDASAQPAALIVMEVLP